MESITLGNILAAMFPAALIAVVGWLLNRAIAGVDDKIEKHAVRQRELEIDMNIMKNTENVNIAKVHARISEAEKELIRTQTELKAHEKYMHGVEDKG